MHCIFRTACIVLALSASLHAEEDAAKYLRTRVFLRDGAVATTDDGGEFPAAKLPPHAYVPEVVGERLSYGRGWVLPRNVMTVDEAVTHFSFEIERRPTDPRLWWLRGVAHRSTKDFEKARADFDEALRLNPEYANALASRGQLRHQSGDENGGFNDIFRAAELEPKNPNRLIDRALVKSMKKDFESALADLESALKLDPEESLTFYYRGLIRDELGDRDAAVEDLSTAIRLEPRVADYYRRRGDLLCKEKEWAAAIKDFDACLRLEPNLPKIMYQRGSCYESLEQYAETERDYRAAIRLDAKCFPALMGLAMQQASCPVAKFRNGAEAVAHAERGIAAYGKENAAFIAILASAYAEAGDFPRAIEFLEKAMRLTPAEKRPLLEPFLALYRAGKPARRPPKGL